MSDFTLKEHRLDSWNCKKKKIDKRININFKDDQNVKFRIKPWSIWWFDVGENVGTETSSHFDKGKASFKRPCIVISSNNFNGATYNKKVIVMPLTSKKQDAKIKHFHYLLKSDDYQGYYDKKKKINFIGLDKDSLVICNEIKTIDTKRLTEFIYPSIKEEDKKAIQEFIKKYISIF